MKFIELRHSDINSVCSYITHAFSNNRQILTMYNNEDILEMRIKNKIECGIVCQTDTDIAGVITAITTNKKNYWAIGLLFVSEKYRNKDIGKKLVSHLGRAISEQYKARYKVNVSVSATNQPALSVFKYNGYNIEGEMKGIIPEDDMIVFGKIFD